MLFWLLNWTENWSEKVAELPQWHEKLQNLVYKDLLHTKLKPSRVPSQHQRVGFVLEALSVTQICLKSSLTPWDLGG